MMTTKLDEIEAPVMQLDELSRAKLPFKILTGLDDSTSTEPAWTFEEQDQLWLDTLDRRVREVREGRVVGRDGETVMREALARCS